MADKLFVGLKTQYKAVAGFAKAGWERITPLKPPEPPAEPQSIAEVLQAELAEIAASRGKRLTGIDKLRTIEEIRAIDQLCAPASAQGTEKDTKGRPVGEPSGKQADNGLMGLCFSGGGIRSATFNLGVTAALAKKEYLKHIDYLSTVSGGGYIGSWLTAWIKREGCDKVQRKLKEDPIKTGDRYLEPDPVRFLRKYSNYLAPRTGLLSTDLWALLAVYLRNVMLNLALLIAAGALILGLPLLGVRYGWHLSGKDLQGTLIWVIRGLLVLAMGAIAYSFASFSRDTQPTSKPRSIVKRPGVWVVTPLLLAAACMTHLLTRSNHTEMKAWVLEGAFWYTIIWVAGSLAAKMFEVLSGRRRGPKPVEVGLVSLVISLMAAVLSGALGGLLLYAFGQALHKLPPALWQSLSARPEPVQVYAYLALWIILGPPLLLWAVALVSVLHVGLLGRGFPDAKREWLSRLCAMLALTAAAWAVLTGLSLYGAVVFKFLFLSKWAVTTWGRVVKWIVAGGWLTAAIGGTIGGNRSKSTTQGGNGSTGILLKLAPPVFILGLLLLLSWGVDWCLRSTPVSANSVAATGLTRDQYNSLIDKTRVAGNTEEFVQGFDDLLKKKAPPSARAVMDQVGTDHWLYAARYLDPPLRAAHYLGPPSKAVGILLILLAMVVALLSYCLDVNEFSIHLLYRNRLTRCYLGASREEKTRKPQPFTGFAVDDDIPVASLRVDPKLTGLENNPDLEKSYGGPYHIVCTALNLVAGKELAWQTRKARSFIYSPLYCGYDFYTDEPASGKLAASAYRRTEWFSGYPGPYLGTALAISGAAASPNMGYHSSPALTFLMTIFNVRLGWWAGNTRHNRTWKVFGPRLALYLGLELMGRTNDEKAFVYLSDGGHFENLGLYELVRRKCRYIIASDGGSDSEYSFCDLGNAIQKCRRDLGAEITIDASKLRPKKDERFSECHYAFGRIKYSDGSEGSLLYLKSSLTKSDRQDIQSFATDHPAFPHDTTADQFFNEDRFESYRALGEDVFKSVIADVKRKLKERGASEDNSEPKSLAGLFTALEQFTQPVSRGAKGSFSLEEVQVAKLKLNFETE